MRLYEFEGKELFRNYGIKVPEGVLIDSLEKITFPGIVKAQLLSGGRKKAGAIIFANSLEEAKRAAASLIGSTFFGEKVSKVLIEKIVDVKEEYYLSITFDALRKKPILMIGLKGGIDVENETVSKVFLDPIEGAKRDEFRNAALSANFPEELAEKISHLCLKLYELFEKEDCRLVEINPLARTGDGLVALDSVVELDDDAFFRHKDRNYIVRDPMGRVLTGRELEVRKANGLDYRGTVKYVELDGDIGFLAAGGGGSITCMDALISHGGRPANYTEFSGNPGDEKMYVLTKAIISKRLNGLWIVGAIANFTLMDETMKGVIKALAEARPRYPIVVRRSGPREREGIELLRRAAEEHGLDMEIHGKEIPLTSTAKTIVEKAGKYGNTHR